jgi:hypothetical protein
MSSMTLIDPTISGNTASRGMGNVGHGGGIYNCPGSSLTIINSALTGNTAEAGGAICNGGFLAITNSTLSGNVAPRAPRRRHIQLRQPDDQEQSYQGQ